jgi:hypothetical protein
MIAFKEASPAKAPAAPPPVKQAAVKREPVKRDTVKQSVVKQDGAPVRSSREAFNAYHRESMRRRRAAAKATAPVDASRPLNKGLA